MFKRLLMVLLGILAWGPTGMAMELGDIHMPDSMEAGETEVLLNGAGVRTKWFMNLYVGGLYLKEKGHNPERIIKADEPMAIRLHIISSLITSEKMEKATMEGFEKATRGNVTPIKAQIKQFLSVFRQKMNKDDTYDFIYLPGKGLQISKNQTLHCQIEGPAFKEALFGIWLCDQPAQKSLKEAMLGL
jgi:hypothetical protein